MSVVWLTAGFNGVLSCGDASTDQGRDGPSAVDGDASTSGDLAPDSGVGDGGADVGADAHDALVDTSVDVGDMGDTTAADSHDALLGDVTDTLGQETDDVVCQPEPRAACCGDALCLDDGCGQVGPPLVNCPFGCTEGACDACVPDCASALCGPDGCGGSCGECADGKHCSEGACVCVPGVELGCCEGSLCPVDSCGNMAEPVAQCVLGCADGACLACEAPCGERVCGDNGCGLSCGECDGGAECRDGACECVPTGEVVCCGDGDALCEVDSCGVVGEAITSCPLGCSEGRCEGCTPECAIDGSPCGPDGCGGSCGSCAAGELCVAGQCSCVASADVACCDDAICRLDSCGKVVGDPISTCAHGCDDGACLACVPECTGRVCGPDGCGGSCGQCGSGAGCQDGACVCLTLGETACCGDDLCLVDACGGLGAVVEMCQHGCEQGACKACQPDCGGDECGRDGCGGVCGVCPSGAECSAGSCECVPDADEVCCGDAVCKADSCGLTGGLVATCIEGCVAGACVVCEPDCGSEFSPKQCGDDGCGQSCGSCGDGMVCTIDGVCVPCSPDCEGKQCGADGCGGSCGECAEGLNCMPDFACQRAVTGRFMRERRLPNASLDAFGPLEVVSVGAGVPVVAVDESSTTLGQSVTEADGRFVIHLDAEPVGALTVTLAAFRMDTSGEPWLGVVDATDVQVYQSEGNQVNAERIWAWSSVLEPGELRMPSWTITEAQGAGAIEIFHQLDRAMARLRAFYNDNSPPTLAILWSPVERAWCLTCFFPGHWGPLAVAHGGGSIVWDRFIYLTGTSYAPHQWTPSMVNHEIGHYIMDIYSRPPGEGGYHNWDSKLVPGLAWSEGFASFAGQWLMSEGAQDQPRFFGSQAGTEYWVDFENIGTEPLADDSSFSPGIFDLPDPEGDMEQTMNEAVVTAILWDLYDATSEAEPEAVALGDDVLVHFASERMIDPSYERGYEKIDLVDFLDALRCPPVLSIEALQSVLMGFPYDNAPSCP